MAVMTRGRFNAPFSLTQSFLDSTTSSLLLTAPEQTHIYRHGAAERSGAAPPGQQQLRGEEKRAGTWCKVVVEGIVRRLGEHKRCRRPFLGVRGALARASMRQPAEGRDDGRVDMQLVAAGGLRLWQWTCH